jgi:hypothetical protein
MKKMKRGIAILLVVTALAVCLTGCTANAKILNGKVVEMLDLLAARDTDGTYAMMHPDISTLEDHRTAVDNLYEYFPITKPYSCRLQNFNVNITNGVKTLEGRYRVIFDETTYIVYASWVSDNNGSGFTDFRVSTEMDLNSSK